MRTTIFFALGILSLMSSCGCPDDQTNTFLLNEFENRIIPFQTITTLSFTDENLNEFDGSYSEKLTEIKDIDSGNDEECYATNIETQFIVLTIPDKNLRLEISLRKSRNDRTTFSIENIPGLFVIEECSTLVENIQEKLIDVDIRNFSYASVFEFKACDDNSDINRILYSLENGIEFIEFDDDTYLRLN